MDLETELSHVRQAIREVTLDLRDPPREWILYYLTRLEECLVNQKLNPREEKA